MNQNRVALENLLDLARIFKSHGIEFVLMYGTLLGAARDGKLIEHDTDIDIGVLNLENHKMAQARSDFERVGLRVFRESGSKNQPADFFSVSRGGEYIDVEILRSRKGLWFESIGRGSDWARSLFFFPLNELTLEGTRFPTPRDHEKLLTVWYGRDWRTPLEGARAHHHRRVRNFLRNLRARAGNLFLL